MEKKFKSCSIESRELIKLRFFLQNLLVLIGFNIFNNPVCLEWDKCFFSSGFSSGLVFIDFFSFSGVLLCVHHTTPTWKTQHWQRDTQIDFHDQMRYVSSQLSESQLAICSGSTNLLTTPTASPTTSVSVPFPPPQIQQLNLGLLVLSQLSILHP